MSLACIAGQPSKKHKKLWIKNYTKVNPFAFAEYKSLSFGKKKRFTNVGTKVEVGHLIRLQLEFMEIFVFSFVTFHSLPKWHLQLWQPINLIDICGNRKKFDIFMCKNFSFTFVWIPLWHRRRHPVSFYSFFSLFHRPFWWRFVLESI